MSAGPGLFEGEVLDDVGGFPCLYRYSPAPRGGKPLAVFIPGGAHLARVSYGGHAGAREEDFLAHWLHQEGFAFLAISYPLETETQVIPATCPGFRIKDWGGQAAIAAKKVIDNNQLSGEIILISWSMGGRVVVPFTKAAVKLGLQVRLYVPLAATPGLAALPGGHPGRENIRCSRTGYASVPILLKVFLPQLRSQAELNGTAAIIPEDVFVREYYGNTPISMLGWLLKHKDGDAEFVDDEGLSIQDSQANEFAALPWIATIYPDGEQDTRHALADKATWNFLFTLRLTGVVELSKRKRPIGDAWSEVSRMVATIPESLSTRIEGNHYFFIGEKGAKRTARVIAQHLEAATVLQSQLAEKLGVSPDHV
ncbi:thioesterase domain protein [Thozetella sp. PMI_491]|nr:thioesterase domain protein [Thozetella sp. PMI_491]